MTREQLDQLSDEQVRVKIAELCGWRVQRQLRPAEGKPILGEYQGEGRLLRIPDYLNSLDAMHEAEKTLAGNQYSEYALTLRGVVGAATRSEDGWFPILSATARQRSEAFLLAT